MKWEGNRESSNVEDRRDSGGGGGGGFGIGGRSIGIGTIAVALVAGWVFGVNPLTVLGMLSGDGGSAPVSQSAPSNQPPAKDSETRFVRTVLASTEDVWTGVFKAAGGKYVEPTLVMFRGATATACGTGQSAMGPFYCPGDQKVYIDLDFFDTLSRQLGAPGQFAQAYVVAHEIGHHVQNLMGITAKVDGMRERLSQTQANALSVRVELQADCLAGVWANKSQQAKGWLEQGDIEQAVNAASHIGDDTLQRQSRGVVRPESFTHGSSQQRVGWFKRGFESGTVNQCNTFESNS
ncbi:MAG: zinc metallopeptidase [Pseudomonadota bacterium]|nr:zinc metallopeptidase [Pseudomonadota bacterium]